MKTYDSGYRGNCPHETVEQVTFFSWIRREYPDTYGAIAIHPRNEGKRRHGQAAWEKAEGMTKGAADIIIPANPPFICELKRRDKTKSRIEKEQKEYLEAADRCGAFVCVAYGYEQAKAAFLDYLKAPPKRGKKEGEIIAEP